MTRIAYVINSVEGGGGALLIPGIARVMADWGAGVEVFALARRDGRALPAIEDAGFRCHVCPVPETRHMATLHWLQARLADWQPALVWTSFTRATLMGLWAARRLGAPVVSWQHNAYLKAGNVALLRAVQSRAALWVADCEPVAVLTRDRLGVPADRVMTWPLFAVDPAAPQARAWQPGQILRIGSLGRLHRAKGYDVLIAALARLAAGGFHPPVPFEVVIGGDGAEHAALAGAARAAGLGNLRLQGYVADNKGFLAGLHAYVQPSRREGFCIAAHEAMQAGLPVILSSVGQMPFSVRPGITGEVVPPENVEALAGALARMLARPEALHAMGLAAARHVAQAFSADRFAANGRAILDHLAPGLRTKGPQGERLAPDSGRFPTTADAGSNRGAP